MTGATKDLVVSCLMPTFARHDRLPRAVAMFLAQRVPEAELVIVSEDGLPDALLDRIPTHVVRHVPCAAGLSLGAKRNLAADAARGRILVHWDDDDLHAGDRLRRQARVFADDRIQLAGSSIVHFHDEDSGRCWEYRYGANDRALPWVCGATLAYRRDYWQRHPFADVTVGEDNLFVWSANRAEVHDMRDPGLCLCAIHAGNTSPKNTADAWWRPIDPPPQWDGTGTSGAGAGAL